MIEKAETILKRNSLCVLATSWADKPHCSLMSYVLDERTLTLYTATINTSRKFKNILQNPHVSLLVDSRLDDGSEIGSIKALSVYGTACVVSDEAAKDAILARIGQTSPHIRDFIRHPDVEVIAIRAESLLLLEGPEKAHFIEVRKGD